MSRALAAPAPPVVPFASAPSRVHPLLRLHNVVTGLSLLIAFLQLYGDTPGEVAALVAVPLAAACVYAADRRYLPALLLLSVPSLGVVSGTQASETGMAFAFPNAVTFVVMAGVEVTAPLVMLAVAFGRVGVELLTGGRAFRGVVPPWIIAVFLLSMLPVLMGGLLGQSMGHNRWSQGPRAMLAIAGVLWGVIVARRAHGQAALHLGRQLAAIAAVGAFLLVAGFLRGMFLFILVGFAGGLLPYFVSRKRLVEAGICLAAVLVAALGMTLTTAGQVLLALGCVMVAHPRARGLGRWLLRLGVLGACVLSALMIWVVMQMQGKTLIEVATRDEGVLAYAVFKLMGDRGPLWLAAIEQIMGGPYLVVPAGRPLRPESFDYGGLVYTWEFGAHNAVLELVRNVGVLGGIGGFILIGFALTAAVRLLLDVRDDALRGVAAGFLGVTIVGITTGNYPVYDVGFFAWAVGGMIAGAGLYAPRRGAPAPSVVAEGEG